MEIKGIGEKTAALFQKLKIETGGGLLLHYPRTYVQCAVADQVAGRDGGGTRQSEKDARCETNEKHAGHSDDHRYGRGGT